MRVTSLKAHISTFSFLALIWQLFTSPISVNGRIWSHSKGAAESVQERFLHAGDSVIRNLNGAGKHVYTIDTRRSETGRFIVQQNGIDVMITIQDSEGKMIKNIDRPSGSYGPESVTFIAPYDGRFTLEVRGFIADAPDGNYEIRFQSASAVVEADRIRDEAENLTSRAEELRASQSREKKLQALPLFQKALQMWQELGDKYEQSVVYYGLGFTQYLLSSHYEAARNYHRALRLAYDLDLDFSKAINHSALGSVQYALSEYDLAKFNYQKAIELYRELRIPRGLGVAYHGLGAAMMLSGEYSGAENALVESMEFRSKANDNSGKVLTGLTLTELALIRAKPAQAEAELVKVQQVIGSEQAAKNSQYLFFLGRTEGELKDFRSAVEHLRRAGAIFKIEGNRLRQSQSMYELSRVQFSMGAIRESLESVKEATSIIDELRRSTPNLRQRINLTATVAPFFGQHVRVLLKLHEMSPADGHDIEAFDISEQARSRGLLDKLERRALIKKELIDPAQLDQENNLRDRISNLLELIRISNARSSLMELQNAEQAFSEIEAGINDSMNSIESKSLSTLTLSEIRTLLPQDVVFLNYAFVADRLVVWTVTKELIKLHDLSEKKTIVDAVTAAYTCFSTAPKPGSRSLCRVESSAVGVVLLKPFASLLDGKRIMVSKNEEMESLPFGAIINPVTKKYVIETNAVTNIPSGSVLRLLQGAPGSTKKTIAIFADPVYSNSDPRLKTVTRQREAQVALPRLFASRLEADGIAALIDPSEVSLNLDFQATREKFFQQNLSDFEILHFAAHAVIDETDPELSSIRLSAVDSEAKPLQGTIRSNDIQRLDLNADLVVLSACRGGLGKQVRGEGFSSLAKDFLTAGARKVMFSYWDVDDRVTAETMVRFYNEYLRKKHDAATSLRETKLSLKTDPRWAHPFYWAAFHLQGDY